VFENLINKVVNYWVIEGIIAETDEDIYAYGLDLLLFSAVNLIVILITALITGKLLESLLLIAVTIPLQMFGGSYHAKSHLNCFLIMYIGWWLAIGIAPNLDHMSAIFIAVCSLVLILCLAPVSHKNVPISSGQSKKMKVLVRIFTITFVVISVLLSDIFLGMQFFSNFIAVGLGAIALSMLAAKVKCSLLTPFA